MNTDVQYHVTGSWKSVDWKRTEAHPLWEGYFSRNFQVLCMGPVSCGQIIHDKFFIDGTFRSLDEFLKAVNSSPFLGSQWTDIHEILHFTVFRKYIEKIQVLLKSDKYNGFFAWRRLCIYGNISFNYSYSEKCFRQNLLIKSKYTF